MPVVSIFADPEVMATFQRRVPLDTQEPPGWGMPPSAELAAEMNRTFKAMNCASRITALEVAAMRREKRIRDA